MSDIIPEISIVIPAYNEERRLPSSLLALYDYMQETQLTYEVLVIVEKSSDNTLALSLEITKNLPHFRIIDNQVHRGKGYAVKSGMLQARGRYIFYMDADLSTPLREIRHFYDNFQKHPEMDILIGNRALQESKITKKQGILRRNMGRIFNVFVNFLAIQGIKDTQCGFKAFKSSCVPPLFSRQSIDSFAFDVEVLLLAQYLHLNIGVRPVEWQNSPDSKVRIIRDSIKMLVDLILLRHRVKKTLRLNPVGQSEDLQRDRAS